MKNLELAVRVYRALVESPMKVSSATVRSWPAMEKALMHSPTLLQEVKGLPTAVRVRVAAYVGQFEPLHESRPVYQFPDVQSATAFVHQVTEEGGTASHLDGGGLVAAVTSDPLTVEHIAASLGGAEYKGPVLEDRFNRVDTRLPMDMLTSALGPDVAERALIEAIYRNNHNGQLSEGRMHVGIQSDGLIKRFETRLNSWCDPKQVFGVDAYLAEATRRAGMWTPDMLRLMEAGAAGVQSTGAAATAATSQASDRGGVAKDQPDARHGSPADSKTGTQEQQPPPTEHVPSQEQGGANNAIRLPDGTEVPFDTMRQAFARMLNNMATQIEQGTVGGQATPRGADQVDATGGPGPQEPAAVQQVQQQAASQQAAGAAADQQAPPEGEGGAPGAAPAAPAPPEGQAAQPAAPGAPAAPEEPQPGQEQPAQPPAAGEAPPEGQAPTAEAPPVQPDPAVEQMLAAAEGGDPEALKQAQGMQGQMTDEQKQRLQALLAQQQQQAPAPAQESYQGDRQQVQLFEVAGAVAKGAAAIGKGAVKGAKAGAAQGAMAAASKLTQKKKKDESLQENLRSALTLLRSENTAEVIRGIRLVKDTGLGGQPHKLVERVLDLMNVMSAHDSPVIRRAARDALASPGLYECVVDEKSPKGWEGTVKAMKDEPGIDNPWALAHHMKGKGYKSRKTKTGKPKKEGLEEEVEGRDPAERALMAAFRQRPPGKPTNPEAVRHRVSRDTGIPISDLMDATDRLVRMGLLVRERSGPNMGMIYAVSESLPVGLNPVDEAFYRLVAEALDVHAMRELELFIDNDYQLYRQAQDIGKNLKRKHEKGRYDSAKAPKLWAYLIQAGARKYVKDFGGDVRTMFPKALRDALAIKYARDFETKPEFDGGLGMAESQQADNLRTMLTEVQHVLDEAHKAMDYAGTSKGKGAKRGEERTYAKPHDVLEGRYVIRQNNNDLTVWAPAVNVASCVALPEGLDYGSGEVEAGTRVAVIERGEHTTVLRMPSGDVVKVSNEHTQECGGGFVGSDLVEVYTAEDILREFDGDTKQLVLVVGSPASGKSFLIKNAIGPAIRETSKRMAEAAIPSIMDLGLKLRQESTFAFRVKVARDDYAALCETKDQAEFEQRLYSERFRHAQPGGETVLLRDYIKWDRFQEHREAGFGRFFSDERVCAYYAAMHEEDEGVSKTAFNDRTHEAFLRMGNCIIVDAAASTPLAEYVAAAKEVGFTTTLVELRSSLDTALARNAQRSRKVSEADVIRAYRATRQQVDALRRDESLDYYHPFTWHQNGDPFTGQFIGEGKIAQRQIGAKTTSQKVDGSNPPQPKKRKQIVKQTTGGAHPNESRIGDGLSLLSEQLDTGQQAESESCAASMKESGEQLKAAREAVFKLTTSTIVQCTSMAQATGAKRTQRELEKAQQMAASFLDELKTLGDQLDKANEAMKAEQGGMGGDTLDAMKQAQDAQANGEPAVPVEVPATPAPAPAVPAPEPGVQAAAAPAIPSMESVDADINAAIMTLMETSLPERIAQGEHYRTLNETVRGYCPTLTTRQRVRTIDRMKAIVNVPTDAALRLSFGAADHRLLSETVPFASPLEGLVDRTRGGRETLASVVELTEAVAVLRKRGRTEHVMLADTLEAALTEVVGVAAGH